MRYKHLLFDFDGVLVDSFKASYDAQTSTSDKLDEKDYRALFHGNIYENLDLKTTETVLPKYQDDHPFFKVYTPKLMDRAPIDGIDAVLENLAQTHVLSMVTSSLDSAVRAYLERYELAHHFDSILGVNVHKSKVAKIRMVCEKYEAEPGHCLFITDTLGDIREARKAGVNAVGVTWGFHDVATLLEGDPVGIVHTPEELLRHIKNAQYR